MDIDSIVKGVLQNNQRSIAKAISFVENNPDKAGLIVDKIYPLTGKARVVGITGPPGAGKSTLTDRLAREFRDKGFKVGVIAIDPSSPFSGGAVLGDRIRMNSLSVLDGVFVRSMATRGVLGGLNRSCMDAIDILDAAGYNYILVETVGVGQDEVDIIKVSDLNLVVLIPGMGDDIQAMKAGIMEIADLFVINKSDREGTDKLITILNHFNALSEKEIPFFKTVAVTGEGVDILAEHIQKEAEKKHKEKASFERRFERAKFRIVKIVQEKALNTVIIKAGDNFNQILSSVLERKESPYSAAENLMDLLCK